MTEVSGVNKFLSDNIISTSTQSYLVDTFMATANNEMVLKIGGLGTTMKNVTQALTALNKINTVASYRIGEGTFTYNAIAENTTLVNSTLWLVRSDLSEGWATLSNMLKNNILPSGTSAMVTSIGEQEINGTYKFKDVVASIEAMSQNAPLNTSIVDNIRGWYSGGNGDPTVTKEWSTQTNVSNAVIEFEFLNNTTSFQLREAILVYQAFADAAGAMLSKINRVLGDMVNQIG